MDCLRRQGDSASCNPFLPQIPDDGQGSHGGGARIPAAGDWSKVSQVCVYRKLLRDRGWHLRQAQWNSSLSCVGMLDGIRSCSENS